MRYLTLILACCIAAVLPLLGQVEPVSQDSVVEEVLFHRSSPERNLSNYIRIPSVSGQEKEAGYFFQGLCRQAGLHIQPFGNENGKFNFAASLYPLSSKKPNLIFLNHIDVVPEGDIEKWLHPPYGGTMTDEQLWGRGAFDNKGVAIMQLHALQQYVALSKEEDLPYNISLLTVSCEETQCEGGARFIAENHLEILNPYIIIGEGPPSLQGVVSSDPEKVIFGIATGHKRAYWLKLSLEVPSAGHSSVTPLEYANKSMLEAMNRLLGKQQKAIYNEENRQILEALGELEGGMLGFVLKKPRLFKAVIMPQLRKQPELFALFSNTITLTNISNPTKAHNTIPESITCLLDCRLLPETDEAAFMSEIRKRLRNDDIQIEVMMSTPQARSSSISHPMYSEIDAVIREYFGREVEVVPLLLPNLNDSGWFRAKGIPVFDFIPASISREHIEAIHSYNERLPVKALEEGIQVYSNFISRVLRSVEQPPLINDEMNE